MIPNCQFDLFVGLNQMITNTIDNHTNNPQSTIGSWQSLYASISRN
jgi:hypothetical protein